MSTDTGATGQLNNDLIADAGRAVEGLYRELHARPELSMQEHWTSARIAQALTDLPVEVTTGVGGTGVVAVLANGAGPRVLIRADIDGLPIREASGVAYASVATQVGADGSEQPVMHACGHDMHAAALVGVLTVLCATQESWAGTIMAVFQPGEETAEGAAAMVGDGFFERFGTPDICLGQHVSPLPAGVLASRAGTLMAAAGSLKITLHGRGGHASMPERTIDPVVMAASTITRLQSVVSREFGTSEPIVVSVSSVHAGNKINVIPDVATLGVNVRALDDDSLQSALDAVSRIAIGESRTSCAPKGPDMQVCDRFPSLRIDPAALARTRPALEGTGATFAELEKPLSGSEDFGVFGTACGAPSVFWHWGGMDPASFTPQMIDILLHTGRLPDSVPVNHSPQFAPDPHHGLLWGVRLMTAAAMAWIAPDSVS